MRPLLFCWELGANFGHLSNFGRLRDELKDRGYGLHVAVADLKAAAELLGQESPLYQAPTWPAYAHHGSDVGTASFADVLTMIGYGQPGHLTAVVRAWLALFALIKPVALIVDHGPAAQFAARIAGLNVIAMGTGFTMPPLDYSAFPPLRADIAPAVPEHDLLAVANGVLSDFEGTRRANRLPELLQSDARIIIGMPELDPYGSFRREGFCSPAGGFAPITDAPSQRRLFVYVGAELPGLTAKLQVLCDLAIPVEFYIRGADRMITEFIRLRGKTVHERPADVREVLTRASHVISQGGAMMSSEALAAGRPHLLLPSHFESHLNAAAIVRLGLGREFPAYNTDTEYFKRQVSEFLGDRDTVQRSTNLARMLATRPLPDAGQQVMLALDRLSREAA